METFGESSQTEEDYGFQIVEYDVSHDHCTPLDLPSPQITPMYLEGSTKNED